MSDFYFAQQARKRACSLLVLAALLVSSTAQDTSSAVVRVKLVFEGIPQADFDTKYNSATLQTVASAAGVPADYVYRIGGPGPSSSSSSSNTTTPSLLVGSTIKPVSSDKLEPTAKATIGSSNNVVATEQVASNAAPLFTEASSNRVVTTATSADTALNSSSGRRLTQVRATAEYGIRANKTAGDWASPEVIRRKVMSSAAGFGQSSSQGSGKGFYATLAKNGVKAEPVVFLDGMQILAGPLTTDAPKSRFGARQTADIEVLDNQDIKAALNPSGSEDQAKQVTLLNAPQPPAGVPAQQKPALQPWVIALIAVGGFLVVAAGSVLVWRKCVSDGMRKSGSRQQFLPRTVADPSA